VVIDLICYIKPENNDKIMELLNKRLDIGMNQIEDLDLEAQNLDINSTLGSKNIL